MKKQDQKLENAVADFFSAMLGQPIEVLETNFTGVNGLEIPSLRYCQLILTRPDGKYSRLNVGTCEGELFFDVVDEEWSRDWL